MSQCDQQIGEHSDADDRGPEPAGEPGIQLRCGLSGTGLGQFRGQVVWQGNSTQLQADKTAWEYLSV